MAKQKITIAELDIDVEALLKSTVDVKKSIDDLKKSQQDLKKSGQESSEQFVKNEVALKKLSTTYGEQKKALVSLTDAENKLIKTQEAENIALKKNISTIEGARSNNKELLASRNRLNLATDEGKKRLTEINKKLDENNKFIKENVSGYEKQKIGIGDYEGALKRTFPALAGVVSGIKSTKEGLQAQKAALLASNSALTASQKALRLFKIALASTGIGLLIVAFGSLVAFLTSTQDGIDQVTKITKPLQVIFQKLIGVSQDLGKDLFEAFSNPKKLLSDLVDFLKTNVLNRFKAFGVVLQGIKNFDLEQVTNGILQFGTGVEDIIGKTKKLAEESATFIKEAVDEGLKLRQIAIDIENAEADLVLTRQKALNEIKKQEVIAKNTALSAAERNKAANIAIETSRRLNEEEGKLLDLKIEEEKINQSLNDSDRKDKKALNELEAERLRLIEKQQTTELKFIGVKSAVTKEEQAKTDKEVEDQKKKEEEELANISAFEKKKQDLKNEISLQNAANEEEKEIAKVESDAEKKRLELDNLVLDEEQRTELLALLKQQEVDAIATIEGKYRDTKKKEDKSLAATEKNLKKKQFDTLVSFAGAETKLGKAILLSKRLTAIKSSLIDLGILKNKTAVNIAAATSDTAAGVASTAKVGFPQNIPLIIGFAAQVGGLIKGIKEAGKAKSFSSFDSGGVVGLDSGNGGRINNGSNIPTQQGGDNIFATVKSGEVILNEDQQRAAGGSSFFASIGVPGFASGGQFINPSSAPSAQASAGGQAKEFAEIVSREINKIKVVAIVDEITDSQDFKAEIVDGANF